MGSRRAAASTPTALINGDSVVNSSDQSGKSDEQVQAEADGFSVTVVSGTTWDSMTEAQFRAYTVLVIGDPDCNNIPASVMSNVGTWTKAVMDSGGNRFTIGSDPVFHSATNSTSNRNHIIKDGIAYAGAAQGKTGAYVDTTCEASSNNTTILDDLSANTSAWTVESPVCSGNIGVISNNPAFSHTSDTDLSGWNCSSHADYPGWSSEWTPFAISADAPTKTYCGTDIYTGTQVCGEPYIFFAGQVGVVPQGSAPGADLLGGGSPSEPLCSCATVTALDPVQLSTGDFVEKASDLTAPGTGIPLAFTRSYDSIAAQRGLGSVAAGSTAPDLGAGWFDNFDMSLSYNTTTQVATVTEENGAQLTLQNYAIGASEPAWCPSDATSAVFCSTAPRMMAQLTHNGDTTWTLTRRLGSPLTFTFNSSGTLTGMSDQQGDTVSSAPYTGSSCPTGDSCTAWSEPTASDTLVIAKATVNGSAQIQKVFELTAGLAATFTSSSTSCASPASSLPELCSATPPGNLTATYSYNGSTNQMLTMTPPTGQVITNTYAGNQLTQQCVTPGTGLPELTTVSYQADSSLVGGTDTTVTTYPNGPGNGCSISGTPVTDSTVYKFSNDALVEVDHAPGTSAASTIRYQVDPATLLPTNKTDGDNNQTRDLLQTYQSSGSQFTAANPTLVFDGAGNTTQHAYTSHNLTWCSVDAADYLNGARCPASQPSGPPAPGATNPNPGVTLSWYDNNDHLTATTDALGNTSTYSYTSGVSGVPNGLRYCNVDPVDYQKSVTCPIYAASHVTGTQTQTFDASGNILTSTDAVGNTTTNCYYYQTTGCASSAPSGGSGGNPQKLYSTTDPDGNATSYTYDAAGHVLTQVTKFGSYSATTLNAYTPGGLLYCSIAPLAYSQGRTSCPSSAPSSPPAAGSDPWPGATITIYDNTGRILDQVNPLGGMTQNAYDGTGNQYCTVSATAYAKGITCPTNPPATPPVVGNDPYLGATITTYDPAGRVIQRTNPLGGITLSSLDAAGNPTQTTVESNNATAAPNVVTGQTFDADNRDISTTVASGTSVAATTAQSYDPNGNVVCSVSANAEAQGSSAFHCPTWQSGWISAPPNPTSLYSTTPSSSQSNNVTTTFYNADSQQVQTTNPDVQTTVTAVDGDGRTYCSADPTNVSAWLSAHSGATYPYLCPSTPPSTAPAQGSNPGYLTNIYDAAGRALSKTDQVGDTTSYTYDPAGPVATTRDPRGYVTTDCYYHQNGTGQCAANAPTGGGSASNLYSTNTPVTGPDPNGETTTTTYYPGGKVDVTTTPSGTTTNVYDASGDLSSVTYGNTASGYTAPTNVTFTYNQDGSRNTMVDATGTTTYSYDNNRDVTSQALTARSGSGLSNTTTSYSFFSTGVVASVVYPSYGSYTNPTVNYSYDATGAMSSETDWLANKVTFNHDADGNQTNQANSVSTSNPNGTSSTGFAYDNADLNTSATSTLAQTCGGNETLTQSFSGSTGSRNPDGQVTQDQESYTGSCSGQTSNQRNYSYDIAGRVIYQGNTAQGSNPNNFAYDPSGDPTTMSSHDGAGNFNTYTQTFDNAGEILSQTPNAGSHGNTTNYKYDTLGDQAGAAGTTYSYDQISRLTAVRSQAQTIVTKKEHTVAVKSDGTVWDWGLNTYGELGNNTTTNSSTPVQVSGLTGAVSVAAGDWQTVALKSDGTVWDWGRNATDGQLGNGNNTTNSSVPVQVINMTGAVAVGAGGDSTFAVKSDGTLWGWGSDAYGQLCNNSTTNTSTAVQANNLTGVIGMSEGYHFTVALKSDGTVWTCGQNDGGQLGNGTTTDSHVPVQVSGLASVIAVSAGDDYGIALKADGTIWAWGHNEHGQLGNNSTSNSSTPVQVSGITTAVAISGAEDAGLAVKSDGSAWGWGLNNNGQLGIGNTTDSHVPVQVHNLTNVVQVAGGLDDSIALKSDGTLWAWGLNNNGELGTGNTTSYNLPTQSNMTSVATSNGGTAATYTYNGDGLTAARANSGTTSQYTWSSLGGSGLPLIVSDSTNDYIYGPTGTPAEQVALFNSTPTYMTYTPSDSSWLTTNNAGDQTGFWRYDAYGTLATGTPTSPFGYSGQYTDTTTGFVNDRSRWYEPQSGGFITRDPAFSQTDTAYTYAGGDPGNRSDPTGMLVDGICGNVSAAIGIPLLAVGAQGEVCALADNHGSAGVATTTAHLDLNLTFLLGGASASVYYLASTAHNIDEMAGPFEAVSVAAYGITGYSGEVFWSISGPLVVGFEGGSGVGGAIAISIWRQDTTIQFHFPNLPVIGDPAANLINRYMSNTGWGSQRQSTALQAALAIYSSAHSGSLLPCISGTSGTTVI